MAFQVRLGVSSAESQCISASSTV
jgi:hypothetical protein